VVNWCVFGGPGRGLVLETKSKQKQKKYGAHLTDAIKVKGNGQGRGLTEGLKARGREE